MLFCRALVVLALCASVVALPQSVAAKNLGLLIGISNYESPEIPKLKAPGNDVRLIWDTLRERGFANEDIVVLADDLAPGQPGQEDPKHLLRPTEENILDELDALSEKVSKGDLVVVYYSGHGSYMRQSKPKVGEHIEFTGFNHILLAIDAEKNDHINADIKGGIVDKTLKKKFEAIKDKKAFLWLILDSCHSGGLTRDASIGVRLHFVDPGILNLPAAEKAEDIQYSNPWINQQVGGKQVAFLAAPEEYPAYEKEVEIGRDYSLFTHTLATTLRGENFSSYRQLARAVLRVQAGVSGNLSSPVFEGDLDQPMFDGSADGPRNWLAKVDPQREEVQIDAGALHGIQVDTVVSFERDKEILGYGKVLKADISSSRAKPIDFNNQAAPKPSTLDGRLTARVVKPAVFFTLKVARPPKQDGDQTGSAKIGFEAIEALISEPNADLPIEWMPPREAGADLHLRVIGGVIYLVSATAELVREGRNRTPAVRILANAEDTAHDLRENLWRVLRQQNIRRIAAKMRDKELSDAVEVKLKLIRDAADLERVSENEKQICKSWKEPVNGFPQKPIIPGQGEAIRLTHCDRVAIEITNRWPKAVDITLLYLDSEGGIGKLPHDVDQARIPPGKAQWSQAYQPIHILTWCGEPKWEFCKYASSEYFPIGIERLMVIIAEADEDSQDRRTFYYLTQPTLAKAREADKVGVKGGDDFDTLMRNAALVHERKRGVGWSGNATIKIFTWEVVSPDQLARSGH